MQNGGGFCLTAAIGAGGGVDAAAQNFTWTGSAADDFWLTPGNWTPAGVPDVAGESATIGGPAPAVLRGNVAIDELTVQTPGVLTVQGQLNLLTFNPVTIDGQATLASGTAPGTGGQLVLQSDAFLSGSGRLTLSDSNAAVRQGGPTTQLFRLTVGADQTVNGFGELGLDSILISNSGLIDADTAAQTLRVNPGSGTDSMINRGLMRATNGGVLELSGAGNGSFFNLDAIHAADGSKVLLADNPSLNGGSGGSTGTLSTAGTGVVRIADNDSAFLFSQVIDGRFEIGDASSLSFGGSITANGRLIAKDAPGGGVLPGMGLGALDLLGDVTNDGELVADAGGTLNVSLVDNTATLTNRGTVRAIDGSRVTLDLAGTLDQRGVFKAVNGGVLTVRNGTPISQIDRSGGIDALTGGTFRADNGRLNIAPTGFDLVVNDGADLSFHGASADTNLFADSASNPGALVSEAFDTNAGSLGLTGGADLTTRLTGPADFTNAGTLTVGAGSTFAVVDGNGNQKTLNNEQGSTSVLRGDGTIFADVFNGFTGEIRPDATDGSSDLATLSIDGDLTLTDESQSGSGGVYLDATADGTDTLVVTGTATLAGALYINSVQSPFPPGFLSLRTATALNTAAQGPQEFLLIDADAIVGDFDLISLDGDTSLTARIDFANGDVFMVIPEPATLGVLLAAAPLLIRRSIR
ncbi:MAG: hypothetical protein AAF086_02840 [Planctomycetota bacterium]